MQGPGSYGNIFTIPQGASSGARITIDGIRGAIFEYDSNGKLVASWASSGGSDDGFGNAYLSGQTVYYESSQVVNQYIAENIDGGIAWYVSNGPGGPYTEADYIQLQQGADQAFTFSMQGIAGTGNGTTVPLTFQNGWAQASGRESTQLKVILDYNRLELSGSVVVPAGFASAQDIMTYSESAYYPLSGQSVTAWDRNSNTPVRLYVGTAGTIQFSGPVTGVTAGDDLDIPATTIILSP